MSAAPLQQFAVGYAPQRGETTYAAQRTWRTGTFSFGWNYRPYAALRDSMFETWISWIIELLSRRGSTRILRLNTLQLAIICGVASFDGAFASIDNLVDAKALGVEDVCFAKKRRLAIRDMVRSQWV